MPIKTKTQNLAYALEWLKLRLTILSIDDDMKTLPIIGRS